MSLTNPNTVVTEERLAEFYQGILPYLGGMPEILANKFSKANMYSTTEKMVGQWTDGKPLYQRTIEITDFSAITSAARNWYVLYTSQDTIYDQIFIKQDATFMSWDGEGQKWRAEPNEYLLDTLSPPSYSVIRPWVDSTGALNISILNSGTSTPYKGSYANKKLHVTIQYTKTTDSAISIGNDTDYSTTEKIVGTWVDGKPLYQKTIVDTTNDTINVSKYISIGASVDKCVSCNGVFLNTDNVFVPLPFFANSVTNNNIAALKVVANPNNASLNKNTVGLVCSSSNFLNRPVYVTVQYTKTTD